MLVDGIVTTQYLNANIVIELCRSLVIQAIFLLNHITTGTFVPGKTNRVTDTVTDTGTEVGETN